MSRAFFLDRDGVINTEAVCLWQPDKAILLPRVPEAIKKIRAAGYVAVVISNQPWVERGVCSVEDQWRVFARLQGLLDAAAGTRLDAFYFCPHSADRTRCNCRKPAPGMILNAAHDLGIAIDQSFMIGDRYTDTGAGQAAGCRDVALVRTGCGIAQIAEFSSKNAQVNTANDLLGAVELLLEKYHEK